MGLSDKVEADYSRVKKSVITNVYLGSRLYVLANNNGETGYARQTLHEQLKKTVVQ